jgi:hypothetical protein
LEPRSPRAPRGFLFRSGRAAVAVDLDGLRDGRVDISADREYFGKFNRGP